MNAPIRNTHLAGLVERVEAQKARTRSFAGELSDAQLKWVPPEGGWGVGMILEHLIMSTEMLYQPVEAKTAEARAKHVLAENPEWKRSLMGGMLVKSLEAPRKVKTTKKFTPQNVNPDVVKRFCDAQDRMLEYMRAADGLDLNKLKIKSPVLSIIRYNLADAFVIHAVHNDRHLNRAEEITRLEGFPAAATV